MPKRKIALQSKKNTRALRRPASPLLLLAAQCGSPGSFTDDFSEPLGALFMAHLADQFAEALANDKLEAALSMLAGCPQLALIPCRKALYSALHWSCASTRLAPATRALLLLGCDPLGYPLGGSASDDESTNTPLRWAVSSGNLDSLRALLSAGASPTLGDLHEACRNAQGACAIAILDSAPQLDPFAPVGRMGVHCHATLAQAARSLRNPINDGRLRVEQALAAFERRSLMGLFPKASENRASKRL